MENCTSPGKPPVHKAIQRWRAGDLYWCSTINGFHRRLEALVANHTSREKPPVHKAIQRWRAGDLCWCSTVNVTPPPRCGELLIWCKICPLQVLHLLYRSSPSWCLRHRLFNPIGTTIWCGQVHFPVLGKTAWIQAVRNSA